MFGFRGKGKSSLKQEVPCKLEMEKKYAIFGIFVVIISEHAFEDGKFSVLCLPLQEVCCSFAEWARGIYVVLL